MRAHSAALGATHLRDNTFEHFDVVVCDEHHAVQSSDPAATKVSTGFCALESDACPVALWEDHGSHVSEHMPDRSANQAAGT